MLSMHRQKYIASSKPIMANKSVFAINPATQGSTTRLDHLGRDLDLPVFSAGLSGHI